MPQSFNGIGTTYYGKTNLVTREGACESCHRHVPLQSYDTRLFFVFLFIPLIPLGKKRILEQCPACTRHRVVKLDEWNQAKQSALSQADAELDAAPESAEAAEKTLVKHMQYQDYDGAARLVERLRPLHAQDARMTRLFGDVLNDTGGKDAGLECWRAALALKDEPETRERIAGRLLDTGDTAGSEPLLRHIVDDGIPDKIDLVIFLGRVFQSKGEHGEALRVFRECESVVPMLRENQAFAMLRELSEKNLDSGKPVPLSTPLTRQMPPAKALAIFAVGIAVVALAYAAVSFCMGQQRKIYLVNGLDKPYEALVNGNHKVMLPANGKPVTVRVPEGSVRVEAANAAPGAAPAEAQIVSGFWGRPFDNRVFVFNPDQSALLEKQSRPYMTRKTREASASTVLPRWEFLFGKPEYEFGAIDYVFEPFPGTVRLSGSSGGVTWKTALRALSLKQLDAGQLFVMAARDDSSRKNILALLEQVLSRKPSEEQLLNIYTGLANPEDSLGFLKKNLERRPLLINWHRMYQSTALQTGGGEQLERDYQNALAKEPDSADLKYLLGRVTRNRAAAMRLYTEACDAPAPCPWAFYARVYHHLAMAEFAEAKSVVEKARQAGASNPQFEPLWRQVLLANGEYDAYIKSFKKEENLLNNTANIALMQAHLAKNDKAGALNVLNFALQEVKAQTTASIYENYSNDLNAAFAWLSGDRENFTRYAKKAKSAGGHFYYALMLGDVAGAEAALQTGVLPGKTKTKPGAGSQVEQLYSINSNLCLYLASMKAGKTDKAGAYLDGVIAAMDKRGGEDEREVARLLKGEGGANKTGFALAADQKALVLAALGLRFPEAKAECFAMAAKLNFNPGHSAMFLASILRDDAATRPTNDVEKK